MSSAYAGSTIWKNFLLILYNIVHKNKKKKHIQFQEEVRKNKLVPVHTTNRLIFYFLMF